MYKLLIIYKIYIYHIEAFIYVFLINSDYYTYLSLIFIYQLLKKKNLAT